MIIDGWGHDLPPGVWEQLAEAIGKTQTTPDDESVGFMESAVDALGQWDSSPRESFGSVASGIYSGTAMLNRPTRRTRTVRWRDGDAETSIVRLELAARPPPDLSPLERLRAIAPAG